MKKINLKMLCIIERIVIIGIVIRLCLFNINGNIRSLIILLGVFLLIFLPDQTKKIYNEKEKNTNNIKDTNFNSSNLDFSENIETKQTEKMEELKKDKSKTLDELNNMKKINYKLPNLDLLCDNIEIKDILQSKEFEDSKSKVLFGVKENLNTKIIDINETSHILIAGTTGIGKTTLLDNIIINILFKSKPNEVKFIMIDTSNNGLRLYNGIPHLLIPVITDSNKSVGTLAWVVQEIENRNRMFFSENVEDFTDFNKKMEANKKSKLSEIIVIIDEIYEIINKDREDVEKELISITRQGKKTGIFLIISTNRPSTDIVSGAIKANIYTRISFFLPSRLDSKLILDMDGAEKLKNHGDVLFKTLGITKPNKYHCPYLSIEGIKNVVEFFLKTNEACYSADILENIENHIYNDIFKNTEDDNYYDIGADPLLMDVIDAVVTTGQASASFIQRRFKIGYARASVLIDQLEERGIISGYQGNKPRQVLMSVERLEELKHNNVL